MKLIELLHNEHRAALSKLPASAIVTEEVNDTLWVKCTSAGYSDVKAMFEAATLLSALLCIDVDAYN